MYPIDRYKFYVDDKKRKVIAVSTYAGKTVRGVAVCDKADEFDLDKGKKLAAARCNLKVAEKRLMRSRQRCKETRLKAFKARAEYEDMINYRKDAMYEAEFAERELNKLLENL